MPTNYTNDGGLGDFIVGQATGAGYNAYSNLGAQYHKPAYTPPVYTPPRGQQTQTASPTYVAQPQRPLTAEEKAELARRRRNINLITARPGFWQRMSGKVLSYIAEDGSFMVNEQGDLIAGELVPKEEHIKRLKAKYQRVWEARVKRLESAAEDDEEAKRQRADAQDRLLQLRMGTMLSPIDPKGQKVTVNLYRTKKGLFGKKQVKNKVWRVSPAQYDARLRLFVSKAYTGGHIGNRLNVEGKALITQPARSVIQAFLLTPD